MRKRRLKTLTDLRRYLGHVLNQFEQGEIDSHHVRTVAYSVNILSNIIDNGDLEARIEALEEQQGGKK